MLLYSEKITHRLEYTIKVIFNFLCRVEYEITDSAEKFRGYPGTKINYSSLEFESAVNIVPSDFLFRKDISSPEFDHGEYNKHIVLFSSKSTSGLPYDIFSSVFYMISRYEEYLKFESDEHGRFPLKENTSFKLGFHKKAIVHHWVEDLLELLESEFPGFHYEKNHFKFIPSFDIDNAFAILNKSWVRTMGGLLKNPTDLPYRFMVLKKQIQDPYDNYSYIEKINKEFGKKAVYFVLCADKHQYDRNIDPNSKPFGALVSGLRKNGNVGIHPSYRSNDEKNCLKIELHLLSDLIKNDVKLSRQHFLILDFPATYNHLIENGITDDYSMGFVEESGFRAGISVSYPFYDVLNDKETELIIHPFAFMESSYMHYKNGSIDLAREELKLTIEEIKNVHGKFIPIWHNESLGEWSSWEGWAQLFEEMYELCEL